MNSFIKKAVIWFKKSSFGIVVTTIAVAFVLCVALIVNENSLTVNKPSESINAVETSSSPSIESSDSSESIVEIEKIKMPFTVDADIARYFFDSSDSIEIRSQALLNYDNKFVPSIGIDYTYNNQIFDVVSSFEGVVVGKVNDSLYGLTIIIENESGLKAHYSGLSETSLFIDDHVSQGQLVGKSGESIINASIGNHLHFAMEFEDNFINPLKAYDKTVSEVIK